MGLRKARKTSGSYSGGSGETRDDDGGFAKVEGRTSGTSDGHEEDIDGIETLHIPPISDW